MARGSSCNSGVGRDCQIGFGAGCVPVWVLWITGAEGLVFWVALWLLPLLLSLAVARALSRRYGPFRAAPFYLFGSTGSLVVLDWPVLLGAILCTPFCVIQSAIFLVGSIVAQTTMGMQERLERAVVSRIPP